MTPCELCPLRPMPCFRPAPADMTESLRLAQETLPARAELAGSGERIYTLFSGLAFRYRALADGRRQIMDLLLPGDLIGPRTGGPEGQGVVAATEIVVCALDGEAFNRLLVEGSMIAAELVGTLFLEAERFERKLLLLGQQRPTERVAFLLLDVQDRRRSRGSAQTGAFGFPFSYRLMSETLGLSRAQLARSLAELRDRGWVRRSDGALALAEEDEMARFCAYDSRLAVMPRTLI